MALLIAIVRKYGGVIELETEHLDPAVLHDAHGELKSVAVEPIPGVLDRVRVVAYEKIAESGDDDLGRFTRYRRT